MGSSGIDGVVGGAVGSMEATAATSGGVEIFDMASVAAAAATAAAAAGNSMTPEVPEGSPLPSFAALPSIPGLQDTLASGVSAVLDPLVGEKFKRLLFANFSPLEYPNPVSALNPFEQSLEKENPTWKVIVLTCIIVLTAIGNILVCVSVLSVRRLRHPSNYLLVSLAVSDLCVALLVMPFAMYFDVVGKWYLGATVCDLWVSFDVASCTASILNLCMISVDRYLAITRPLTYGVRRTSKRICCYVCGVWSMSCLISIPPVIVLGNEHGTDEEPNCQVCPNLAYQLYATLGAFYIPLLIMIVMYYKIYAAAKRVVDADQRAQINPQVLLNNSKNDGWHESGEDGQLAHNGDNPLGGGGGGGGIKGSSSGSAVSSGVQSWQNNMRRSTMLRERKASITLGLSTRI
ncbi:5-hydroxytryptamine receptor 1-like isoform X3 [Varroa jacobsoni]|uniref:G-protein coupled receptors family 1 profile domain-containing protein n=1 Tax=Varroa destructor TaxID=109461 RepID=A0A7M7K7M4_VARDE|nr:5-hydroxytryptamine receptor 1-like isoform X2 [Varroa destructor]XP_022703404.1 5-hydroxytryptamine receptor 1-like isoform X3 [Varroa jacobsoni]